MKGGFAHRCVNEASCDADDDDDDDEDISKEDADDDDDDEDISKEVSFTGL